jgi:hypothetical protein
VNIKKLTELAACINNQNFPYITVHSDLQKKKKLINDEISYPNENSGAKVQGNKPGSK